MKNENAEKSLRVLIVDDNAQFADTLAALVRLEGHEVFVAYNGHDGLQLATETVPEVVFHDIELPDMDGHEAPRLLRQDARLAKAMLVALTGSTSKSIIDSTREAGFDRYIRKPLDYPAMVDALHVAALTKAALSVRIACTHGHDRSVRIIR